MPTRVVAPLTGTVTTGTWVMNQRLNVAAMPNGFISFHYLLPAQYNPSGSISYPVLFHGHENDEGMGGSGYPNSGSSLVGPGSEPDSAYNTVAFRTAFPCIVVVPACDQSIDQSGANGNANFAGYGDSANSGGNEQGINALVAWVKTNLLADPTAFLCTGSSLGAIGSVAWLVDNNAINGVNRIWAGGMGLSDQLFRPGVNGGSNTAAFDAMHDVGYIAVSTPFDNNADIYDGAAWQRYTGNSNYPTEAQFASGGVAAIKAGTSKFYYIRMTSSQMPWDTYRRLNADGGNGTALYNLLFSFLPAAAGGGGGGGTGPAMTVLTPTSGGTITDSSGAVWALAANGDVLKNNVAVNGGGGTGALAVVGTTAWGLDANPGGHWYTFNGTVWTDQGTATPPVVPNQVTGLANGTPGTTTVSLTWAVPLLATGYVLQKSTNGGAFANVTPAPTTNSYSVTGLTAGTPYAFQVAATDPTGTGAFSTPVSFTTAGGGLALPSAPTGLTASAITSSGATLNWTAGSGGGAVASYRIEDNRSGTFAQQGTVAAGTTTFNLTGLGATTPDQARVFAVNATGPSASPSNTASFTTLAGGPTKASVQAEITNAGSLVTSLTALLATINTDVGNL